MFLERLDCSWYVANVKINNLSQIFQDNAVIAIKISTNTHRDILTQISYIMRTHQSRCDICTKCS